MARAALAAAALALAALGLYGLLAQTVRERVPEIGVRMALVSLAACAVPAWRAAQVDPLRALRSE